MLSTDFHERLENLSIETCDMHRTIVSLMEELEAIGWYNGAVMHMTAHRQRAIRIRVIAVIVIGFGLLPIREGSVVLFYDGAARDNSWRPWHLNTLSVQWLMRWSAFPNPS
ncbi:ferritin family protein [Nitrosomonas eutropha]|uniref:Uncharacterized protein n=2 Tax=Nitrosomonas eutropha TaxID=916 RepID=A0ABX5M6J2_9PROT|nr:hypothetical protein [Nitrosomonas eutropha]ABI59240.1 hypothetical protein Neut_0980 [Nitrosomonas eutropha C91]PXV72601.1 hypothetical protein C8R14_1693 [Nitrosomonas eutropha]SCX18657.1 hypothetical protein SAMN05216379_11278 [Nitrosomonas eutropha]SEI61078.1 hypothetical protein SAMN05216318_1072 [Nitrosomonas eutropha]